MREPRCDICGNAHELCHCHDIALVAPMTDNAKPQAVPKCDVDEHGVCARSSWHVSVCDFKDCDKVEPVQPIQADVEALTELDALIAAAKNGSDYWPLLGTLERARAAIVTERPRPLCGDTAPHEAHKTMVADKVGPMVGQCVGIPVPVTEARCEHGKTGPHRFRAGNYGCEYGCDCDGPAHQGTLQPARDEDAAL